MREEVLELNGFCQVGNQSKGGGKQDTATFSITLYDISNS